MEIIELERAIVFNALSKPSTIMGVDYDYFLITMTVLMLGFIFADSLRVFLLFIPLHAVGWVLGKIDPHIFRLLSVRATVGMTKNKKRWGCQTYEAS